MIPLPNDSSLLKAYSYATATKTLRLEFKKGGALWDYTPVDNILEFLEAPSHGSYFLAHIKNNPAITARKVIEL